VTIGVFVVDTVIALPKAVVQVLTTKRDSVKDRNTAKRIKANFMSDQGIMKIKHKHFTEIVNYINSISSNYVSKIKLEEASKIYSSGNLYRCQVTSQFACDDGRHGHYIEAKSEADAIKVCEEYAEDVGIYYCKLPDIKFDEYVNQVTC